MEIWLLYGCLTKGLVAGETFFSLVLNFQASHSHFLAREGDPGGWDLVSVSLFLLLAVCSKILYDFSRLALISSFFSISSFKNPLSYVWTWSPGESLCCFVTIHVSQAWDEVLREWSMCTGQPSWWASLPTCLSPQLPAVLTRGANANLQHNVAERPKVKC